MRLVIAVDPAVVDVLGAVGVVPAVFNTLAAVGVHRVPAIAGVPAGFSVLSVAGILAVGGTLYVLNTHCCMRLVIVVDPADVDVLGAVGVVPAFYRFS
jgi:hypothetical protein